MLPVGSVFSDSENCAVPTHDFYTPALHKDVLHFSSLMILRHQPKRLKTNVKKNCCMMQHAWTVEVRDISDGCWDWSLQQKV
jgi:hypothetical protein